MELKAKQRWGSNELQAELKVGQRWGSSLLLVGLRLEQRWVSRAIQVHGAAGGATVELQ